MNTTWKRVLLIGLLVVAVVALSAQLVAAVPTSPTVAVSAKDSGTTEDGLDYDPNDIIVRETTYSTTVAADSTNWYTLFDGDEHGLSPQHDIAAFSLDTDGPIGVVCGLYCVDTIYISFAQASVLVPDINPKVRGEDVVAFTPDEVCAGGAGTDCTNDVGSGSYSMVFDGSDVGLTTAAEKIDSLDVWPEEFISDVTFPEDCLAGILFISTHGAYRVPAANGGSLIGDGSDILIFCATNLGADTEGFWFRGFDASDEGWPVAAKNSLYGIDVHDYYAFGAGEEEEDEAAWLEFTFIVKNSFNVPSASGGPSEIFGYPDCGGVFGPIDDLNETWPALNGTATGYDLPEGFYTGDC